MTGWLISLAGKVIMAAVCIFLVVAPFFTLFVKKPDEEDKEGDS